MRIAQLRPFLRVRRHGFMVERSIFDRGIDQAGSSGNSFGDWYFITSAELVPCTSRALRLDPNVRDPIPHYTLMLDKVSERAADFDILHFHIDYLHFPLFCSKAARTVTTLHGRQDLADHMPFYRRFPYMPLISISNAQRTPLRGANFVGTVIRLPLDLNNRVGRQPATLRFYGRSRRKAALIAPLPLLVLQVFRLKLRRRLIRWMRPTSGR